jgi:hypothetical protein
MTRTQHAPHMKLCDYCGKENDDAATNCVRCGNDSFVIETEPIMQESPPSADFRLRDIFGMPESLFRGLVVAGTGANLLELISPFIELRFLSYETNDLLNYDGYGALLPIPISIAWLMSLIYLAARIGLYRFSASARALFAILTVAFGLLGLCSGVRIASASVCFLGRVRVLADGALLLLAYGTPLKRRFG